MSNLVHNEQVKLSATFWNNLGVAALLGVFLVPAFYTRHTALQQALSIGVGLAAAIGLRMVAHGGCGGCGTEPVIPSKQVRARQHCRAGHRPPRCRQHQMHARKEHLPREAALLGLWRGLARRSRLVLPARLGCRFDRRDRPSFGAWRWNFQVRAQNASSSSQVTSHSQLSNSSARTKAFCSPGQWPTTPCSRWFHCSSSSC
jgi:hypothetical protein